MDVFGVALLELPPHPNKRNKLNPAKAIIILLSPTIIQDIILTSVDLTLEPD
jgi:hypothetical protein